MQPLRPFLRDRADHGCAGLRRLDERVMDLRQIRIELRQPFLCRQTAPGAVPVGLVSGCAGTAVGKLWPGASGQQICHPVAVLDPGVSYRAHRRILPDGMQDLCPIPFRGIRPLIDRIVRCPGREAGRDLRGLRTGSVILPEMEHGVRVFLKAGQQRQRRARPVDRAGCRAGRVDRQCRNAAADSLSGCCTGLRHAGAERLEIVLRVLAELSDAGIAVQPLRPARISGRRLRSDLPVARAHNDRPYRIRAKIDPNHIFHLLFPVSHSCCLLSDRS